jgi:ubiquinone biosynthesis protein
VAVPEKMKKNRDLLVGLPKDFRRLLRAARRGALRVHTDIAELERFGERLDRAASRLTIGMITAALIIGTSIMMSVSGGTEYLGMTILASFGFAMATLGGLGAGIDLAWPPLAGC